MPPARSSPRVAPSKGQGRITSFFSTKSTQPATNQSSATTATTPTKSSPLASRKATTASSHKHDMVRDKDKARPSKSLFRQESDLELSDAESSSVPSVASSESFGLRKNRRRNDDSGSEYNDDTACKNGVLDSSSDDNDSDDDAYSHTPSASIASSRASSPRLGSSLLSTPSEDSPGTPADQPESGLHGYYFGTNPFVDLSNQPAAARTELLRSDKHTKKQQHQQQQKHPIKPERSITSSTHDVSKHKSDRLAPLFETPKSKRKLEELDDFIDDDEESDDGRRRSAKAKKGPAAKKGGPAPSTSSGKGWKSAFAQDRAFQRMPFVPKPADVAMHMADAKRKAEAGQYPPIHDLSDIFGDMIRRAPGIVELAKTLQHRPLRVATMCSGTESPLLALELMCRAIREQHGIRIQVQHVFSCEIEPFKQAYIERNFSPPILFRDVTELGGRRAHTAYGALVDVPGDVDLLVAGTSCVDYSHLNNNKKGLNDGGESGRTFRGMLEWVMRHKPTLVVLENVKNAPWVGVAETIVAEAGYDVGFSNTFDTKNYYIPHTRQRGYLVATRNTRDCLPENWQLLANHLIRPASSPLDAFLLPTDDPRIQRVRRQFAHGEGLSKGRSTIDWSKCQSRHERARDEEELGKTRPLTAWEEGGTCKMSHHGWNEWAVRQPERVTDLLDITTLRFATLGQDPIYKSKIWELSQNVDRNVAASKPGVAPCLTPTGMPFLTSRGGPLIGLEALSLQGLPLDELLLTRERDDQLQDLAGNAMSSTVVGACVLSALLVGMQDLEKDGQKRSKIKEITVADAAADSVVVETAQNDAKQPITHADQLRTQQLDLTSSALVSMPDLLNTATDSSQLCICEGRTRVVDRPIYRCRRCDHTACESCKGRPTHDLVLDTHVRLQPDEFAPKLKAALPMRLQAEGLSLDIIRSVSAGLPFKDDKVARAWSSRVAEVLDNVEFRFHSLLRGKVWQAQFAAPGARLDLVLDPAEPMWRIFVDPRSGEPAGSPVRSLLIQPVARMSLDPTAKNVSLLHGKWELCLPTFTLTTATIRSTGDRVPTWQSAMGLAGKFAGNQRYSQMHVSVPDSVRDKLDIDVEGSYDLLEQCGTACGGLHVRRQNNDQGESGSGSGDPSPWQKERRLFLFIDADRFKDQSADRFVFSTDISPWPYPMERVSVAKLNAGWTPKHARDDRDEMVEQVELQISGTWKPVDASFSVKAGSNVDGEIGMPVSAYDLDLRKEGCESSIAVLTCEAPVSGTGDDHRIWPADGAWGQVDLLHKTNTTFSQLAWLVERLPEIKAFRSWMRADHDPFDCATANCARCAPAEPDIQWLAVPGKPVAPIEDTMQAGPYEQALKNRPSPFVVHLRRQEGLAQVRFGLNAATLMHRAASRLPPAVHAGNVELSWRLTRLERALDMFSLPKYTLQSNRDDAEAASPALFALELRKEQKRSLTWMLAQEREEVEPFLEEEISEGLLTPLGWRAEGRAVRPVTVRGGVLADAVGYGKTCISLALIASSPYRKAKPVLSAQDEGTYIPTKATLIIVPGHLCKQWQKEVRKFCKAKLSVLVVTAKGELNRLTVRDVLDADIIIMSVTVYKSDAYWETLARVAAANPLPNKAGRFFNAALKKSLAALKNRVRELTSGGDDAAKRLAQSIRDRVDFDDSHITTHKARSRLKGQQYAEAQKERDHDVIDVDALDSDDVVEVKTGSKAKGKAFSHGELPKELQSSGKREPDPWSLSSSAVKRDWRNMTCPPLEMFMWNRVIVDEFHYIGEAMDRTLAGVTSLQARSKWILSGTPPTADFADVKSIAVFLNVHLGVDDDADTTKDSVRKAREKNRTAAEKFNNFREMHSPAWHHRRQRVAQRFLDRFVRSNEPEIGELPSEQLIKPIRLPAAESALYLELAHAIENLDLRHQRKVFRSAKPKKTLAAAKRGTGKKDILDDDDDDAFLDDGDDDDDGHGDGRKKKKGAAAAKKKTTTAGKKGDPALEMSHRDQRLIDTLGCSASPEEALLKRASVYDDFAGVDLDAMEGVNNAIKACEYIVRERRKQLSDCRRQLARELPVALEQHLLVLHHFGYRDENRQAFADYVRNAHNAAWGDDESKSIVHDILEQTGCTAASVTKAAARAYFSKPGVLQAALKRREAERKAAAKGGADADDGGKKKPDPKEVAWLEEYHLRALVHQLTRLRNELVGRVNALRFFTMIRDCQRAHLEGVSVSVTCPGSGCKHPAGEPLGLDSVSISSTCGHSGCRDCVLREAYIGKCPTDGCAALAKPTSIVQASSLGAEDDGKATRYGTKLALLCSLLKRIPRDERALVFCQFDTLTATVAEALGEYGISFVQLAGTAKRRSDLLEAYQDETGARVLLLNVDDESAAGSNLTVANHVIFVGPLLKQEQQQYDATMTQAIGRCVRYGQLKKVFVWRLITLDTIDQEILEKREDRALDQQQISLCENRFTDALGGKPLTLQDVASSSTSKDRKRKRHSSPPTSPKRSSPKKRPSATSSAKRHRVTIIDSDDSDDDE